MAKRFSELERAAIQTLIPQDYSYGNQMISSGNLSQALPNLQYIPSTIASTRYEGATLKNMVTTRQK